MKTIVQIVQHLRPGGIESIALDLMAFSKKHEKTIIISLEGNIDTAIRNWPRLQKVEDNIIFMHKKPGRQPLLIIQLRKLFKKLAVDVVHTHHIGPLLYAGMAARLSGIKCLIHTEHDAWHLTDPARCKLQRWVNRLIRSLLIADAQAVARNMQHFLSINDVQIIHNGIDTKRFTPGDQARARQQSGLPQDVKLIGCSGRMEAVKGQDNLIHALAQLPEQVHLALAGTGETESKLRQLGKKLNLNNRIHFMGHIDHMPNFYRALDIFCLPSINEGYPLSPLEAQACNIPTAVTNVGGSRETLCPVSGKLIPPQNIDAMASTLYNMLQPQFNKETIYPRRFVQLNGDVRNMVLAYSRLAYAGA